MKMIIVRFSALLGLNIWLKPPSGKPVENGLIQNSIAHRDPAVQRLV
jgi:hypothetical protein